MKKLTLTLLISTFGLCAWATNAQDALNFYKQELTSFPTQNSRATRAYAVALADGLQTWLQQNEKHASTPEVLLWQARLFTQAGRNGQALVTLFKLRYMFPQTDRTQLTSIWGENINVIDYKLQDSATKLFAQGPSEKAAFVEQKEAEMLYALSKLAGDEFYPAAAQAFENFFVRHPFYERNNEAELWYGDLHRGNKNYLAAIAQYKKADALYPNSPYKAASLRLIGDIYADNLKNTAAATEAYTTVLRLYPNSSETGIVYKHMAILDENNKQYDSALINYDKAIELLGDAPAVYEAYRGKADVYEKTKQHENAYNVLHHAAELTSISKEQAADALAEAAKIAHKKLKDETKYVQSLEKAVLLAPNDPKTAQRMCEIGDSYTKQGKLANAQEMYKKLILQFPTSKYASSAQGKLTRLQNTK